MYRSLALSLLGLATNVQTTAQERKETRTDVRLLDLTGDGLLDMLLMHADGSLTVSVNEGGRSFVPIRQELPQVLVREVLASDLDGDSHLDLYLVSSGENVALLGDGSGSFFEATLELGLADAGAGVSAERLDVDADGLVDLVLHNERGDVLFWAEVQGSFRRSEETPAVVAPPLVVPVVAGPSFEDGRGALASRQPSANALPPDSGESTNDHPAPPLHDPRGSDGTSRTPTLDAGVAATPTGPLVLASASGPSGSLPIVATPDVLCAGSIEDLGAPGNCLQASSVPTPGLLFPPPHDGGVNNVQSGVNSFIGGGRDNTASGFYATVGGGGGTGYYYSSLGNTASGNGATVGGGFLNTASDSAATVGGGYGNDASGGGATVGGGKANTASGLLATVGGGFGNIASRRESTVGGGQYNTASGYLATVGGGELNTASGAHATVGGGGGYYRGNDASGGLATVGGGNANTASGYSATVGGGRYNTASGSHATVGGGGGYYGGNTASGSRATVSGGYHNTASGGHSTVGGGAYNTALGDFSFAAGRRTKANHNGSFVWGDSYDGDKTSSAADQFNVFASGGARIFSNSAATTGVLLAAGGGSWSSVSDRASKENVEPVDAREVLERVVSLPIMTWNYKAQDDSIRHMGPIAQDFHAAFGLGVSDKMIDTIDPDGVALAAIQGLNAVQKEQESEVASVQERLAAKEAQIGELRERVARLEAVEAELANLKATLQQLLEVR